MRVEWRAEPVRRAPARDGPEAFLEQAHAERAPAPRPVKYGAGALLPLHLHDTVAARARDAVAVARVEPEPAAGAEDRIATGAQVPVTVAEAATAVDPGRRRVVRTLRQNHGQAAVLEGSGPASGGKTSACPAISR